MTQGHQGSWIVSILGDDLMVSDRCQYDIQVASPTVVTVGRLPSKIVVGHPVVVQCSASGGHPVPDLSAEIVAGNQSRLLEVSSQS